MTYTFVIASLFGSICLTQKTEDTATIPSVEQVYKVGKNTETKYYQPIYVDTHQKAETGLERSSLYETLLNES